MCQSYVTSVSGFLAYLYVCIFYNVENCDLREDMCCNSILSFCIHPKRGLITRKINKLSSFKTFISVLSAFELYNFYWNYICSCITLVTWSRFGKECQSPYSWAKYFESMRVWWITMDHTKIWVGYYMVTKWARYKYEPTAAIPALHPKTSNHQFLQAQLS